MLTIKQRQLNLRTYYYFYKGNIDGIVGNQTKQAYRDFQRFTGLVVDGIYGNNTNYKLIEVIKDLQRKLNSKGFNLAVDGIVGNATINAIKTFQRNNGLSQDGIAGKNTFYKLNNTPDTSNKYRYPVNYINITQYYSSSHRALDLGWSSKYYGSNQAIYACYDGTVTVNSYASDAGYYVAIRHDNGDVSRYMHLKNKSWVKVGQRVGKGEHIGTMGDTGNARGNHLHFDLTKNGSRVNPIDYLYVYSGQVVSDACKNIVRYI